MFTEADRCLACFSAQHHSVFTLRDAGDAGLTRAQIDHRVATAWVRVHDGVYRMPGVQPTWRSDLLAACRVAGSLSAISTAEPVPFTSFRAVAAISSNWTCKRWLRARRTGLVVHESTRLDERDIGLLDGIPIMRPERVVLELAGLRPYPDYVEAVVHAARRKRLITFESTSEVFNRHARRGLRGVRA